MMVKLRILVYGLAMIFCFHNTILAKNVGVKSTQESAIEKLLNYEQTLNDKKEAIGFASINQNDLDPKYFPENHPVFGIYSVLVPVDQVTIIQTANDIPREFLFETVNGRRYVRFFVHPESVNFFRSQLQEYEWREGLVASPTASHRSVVCWDQNAPLERFNIKLSLDKRIGGASRLLNREQIERASIISLYIKRIRQEELAAYGMQFVDEPFSVFIKNFEYGYSYRAFPDLAPGTELVPMFSLYATKNIERPMLVDMIERSGLQADVFVKKYIIDPMITQLSFLAFEYGLIAEPHEQNVLLEIRDGLPTGRFFYRDLAGFSVNPELLAAAGKNLDFVANGFRLENLRTERADFAKNMRNYLNRSNFFALGEGLKNYYPQINKQWLDQQFFPEWMTEFFTIPANE